MPDADRLAMEISGSASINSTMRRCVAFRFTDSLLSALLSALPQLLRRVARKDLCISQKFYQTGRFCAKIGQKTPATRPFPSAPIFSRFVIFPLLPKTFHTQTGRAIPVRTTLARRKNPPRRYSLISNTHQKKFPLQAVLSRKNRFRRNVRK